MEAARYQVVARRQASRRLRQARAVLRGNRQVRRNRIRMRLAAARFRPLRILLATLSVITRSDTQQFIAGTAYYAMLALAPVSLGLFQLLGLAMGDARAQHFFNHLAETMLPVHIDIGGLIPATGLDVQAGIAGTLALLGLLWGSFKLFSSMGLVINYVWGITPAQVSFGDKIREYLFLAATSMMMMLSGGITVIVQHAMASPDLIYGDGVAPTAVDGNAWWIFLLSWPLSTLAFTMVYRYLPERHVDWRWAAVGGFLGALGFHLMNQLFALFLNNFAPSHLLYWPMAAALVFMVWTFTASVILVAGAGVSAFAQTIYTGDGPALGTGWFLGNGRRHAPAPAHAPTPAPSR